MKKSNKELKSSLKPTKSEAIDILWRKGILIWKLNSAQRKMHEMFYGSKYRIPVFNLSRRCLEEDTQIMTPNGPIKIQELKPDDIVYGYNKDGSIKEAKILEVYDNGIQEVIDINYQNKKLCASTEDHVWLTKVRTRNGVRKPIIDELELKDIKSNMGIVKYNVDIPCGKVNEPHAYAIGALLGDGCSKQNPINNIYISSQDKLIPENVANILGAHVYKNGGGNHTWIIKTVVHDRSKSAGENKGTKVKCNYYDGWVKDRYAHEKIIDYSIVDTWNRRSCLKLLAGLLDTDGSVRYNNPDNSLLITISMQAKSVIDCFEKLCYKLWQIKFHRSLDNRPKYKNGPCHVLTLKNNYEVPRMLKELDKYLVTPRKKYKKEYKDLNAHNRSEGNIGITKGNKKQAKSYDIQIDNETNMYLTADGLVTHNCGKSRSLLVLALEHCIKNPNISVHYACPTAIMATKIVIPEMRKLLLDCPDDLRPKYYKHDKMFEFTNGSKIQIEGCDDGNADRLRGTATNLGIVDEAGFVKELDYLVNDILLPQISTTNGKLILSSTPPKSVAHPFVEFARKAEKEGAYLKMSILEALEMIKNDPPGMQHINIEIINEIKESIGETSPTWRREYMVEIITDQTHSVVPEFTDQVQKETVLEWHRPSYYDTYTSMDPGLVDNTGVLFAYLDFTEARIVIEDEYLVSGNQVTTENIASVIKAKEHMLWARDGISAKVYMRISDNEPILLNDLAHLHGMNFIPTRKDDKEAAINDLRMKMAQKKIIINPRCVNLIYQLKAATWNKRRTSFDRTTEGGHFDLIDALLYLVRNVHWYKNPFPHGGYNMDKQHVSSWNNKELTPSQAGVKNMFIRKRKTS